MNIDDLKRDLVSSKVGGERSEAIGWNECIDYLASRGLIAQGWRTMDSAPKDGTDIYATRVDLLVFRPSIIYFEQHENRGWLCSQTHRPVKSQPTVWQPLPSPPQGD